MGKKKVVESVFDGTKKRNREGGYKRTRKASARRRLAGKEGTARFHCRKTVVLMKFVEKEKGGGHDREKKRNSTRGETNPCIREGGEKFRHIRPLRSRKRKRTMTAAKEGKCSVL